MLSLVGISYGRRWMIKEAIDEIARADSIIGYQGFIDQVSDLFKIDARAFDVLEDIREDETFLTARVRRAVEEVESGRRTVILSSGDMNVYGMSGAVFRELDRLMLPQISNSTTVIPGISAYQIAASRLGGLLTNGFATLALCIAEVEENVVDRYVRAAAEGDFVTIVYMLRHNGEMFPELYPEIDDPRQLSNCRIMKMYETFRSHRRDDAPCIIASELGNENESIIKISLEDLPNHVDEITDHTILFISSSRTLDFGHVLVTRTW